MGIIDDVLGLVPTAVSSQDIKTQFEFDASDVAEFSNIINVGYSNIRACLNAEIPILWKQNDLNKELTSLKAEVYAKGGGVQELNREIRASDAITEVEANLEAIRVSLQILTNEVRYNENLIKSVNSLMYSTK